MSIEAMKQALDALELAQDNLRPHEDNCFLHDEGEYNRCFCGKDSLSNFLQEQAESLSHAIAEADKQEPVAWGVDWGKAGDTPCVSIIKRLPDGRIEVVAVEYAPYTNPKPNVTTSDMKQEPVAKTAKQRHEENT